MSSVMLTVLTPRGRESRERDRRTSRRHVGPMGDPSSVTGLPASAAKGLLRVRGELEGSTLLGESGPLNGDGIDALHALLPNLCWWSRSMSTTDFCWCSRSWNADVRDACSTPRLLTALLGLLSLLVLEGVEVSTTTEVRSVWDLPLGNGLPLASSACKAKVKGRACPPNPRWGTPSLCDKSRCWGLSPIRLRFCRNPLE